MIREIKLQYSSGSILTEVFGAAGVNVSSKDYAGGKPECVRVYEDGRVQQY